MFHLKPKFAQTIVTLASLFVLMSLACAGSGAPAPSQVKVAPRSEVKREESKKEAPSEGFAVATASPSTGGEKVPNDKPYDAVFFENYGVNPFIDTEDDHLSTFALDVDTGSYTIARRYINDGNLPDKNSVRVEEFVNYFAQDYPYPKEQAFAIYMDGAPTPFTEGERYQVLRVGIQGYAVPPEERKDMALTFVIDVSGSMDMENRLGLVKQALGLLVEQLRAKDTVSIVVYGTTAHVVLEPTSGANQEVIINAINALRPEGSTNAEAGLKLGYTKALEAFKPSGINRVILCSDGVANVGNTGAGSIWETIKSKASEGITLTSLGFGMGNYNDVLLEQLADNGNGIYAYIDTLQEAKRLFLENLTSTLQVIAMNAKLQVDFNPQVVSRYRLVGFENRAIADEKFRDDTVDAGEIGAGHKVTALYEIKLKPETKGQVATVYLRWEDPETHKVSEINQIFDSSAIAPSFSEAAPRFQLAVLVAEYAEILRQSYWAQKNTLAGVLEDAERVGRLFPKDNDVAEFVGLVRRAAQLKR